MSPVAESGPFGRESSQTNGELGEGQQTSHGPAAIVIRRLARNMTEKELRSMFLFAKDFIDSEFISPDLAEDQGFVSALARFKSGPAAQEAKAMLDGKPNTATEANMVVEVLAGSGNSGPNSRRNTNDRGPSSSASSTASSNGANTRQSSRYNGTFQNMERISPPGAPAVGLMPGHHLANGEFPTPESGSHFKSLFSPQSPIGNQTNEAGRVTGKSVINDDSVDDDETGELLKDPVAYAKGGTATASSASARRAGAGHGHGHVHGHGHAHAHGGPPISRFAGLSLSTSNVAGTGPAGFGSSRNGMALTSPTSAMSAASLGPLTPNAAGYPASAGPHYQRLNYPPVNPADQNPPCNTLYVGNLPIDTSEDELKAMFSKQRGYKRLCFRTKQNGPMCFVEFEDVSFATKALNELYGHPLHNSVKGGIRLSFSKNPLGVRTGQPGAGAGMSTAAAGHGGMATLNGAVSGAAVLPFATANGPPPGLAAPPGLTSPMAGMGGAVNNLAAPIGSGGGGGGFGGNGGFGGANNGMAGLRGHPMAGGIATGGHSGSMQAADGAFPEYMMGR